MDDRFYAGKLVFDRKPDRKDVLNLGELVSRAGCSLSLGRSYADWKGRGHVIPFVIGDLKRGVPDWVAATRRELGEEAFPEFCALYWEEELARIFCCRVEGSLRDLSLDNACHLGPLLRATGPRRYNLRSEGEGEDPGSAPTAEVPSLRDALAELDALVGLSHVKRQVHDIVKVVQNRGAGALPCMHMVFTGNPGTGKTQVARIVAKVLAALGVVSGGKFVETDRSGLVGEFVGHTAQRTRRVVESAMGGVLFIDEAYALGMYAADLGAGPDGAGGRRDFGGEAIDTLVKLLEDRRGDFVCIMAGYPAEMERMLGMNPGLRDRIGWFVGFDDYDADELSQIAEKMLAERGCEASPDAGEMLRGALVSVAARAGEGFSNARLVRKLVERCVFEQNVRSSGTVIEACDVARALAQDDIAAMVGADAAPALPFGFAGAMA